MYRLLLILRWIGAIGFACIVFFTVITVGLLVTQPDVGTVFTYVFEILNFVATVLAFALGALVVPREQRKAAVLVLWMLAVALFGWPLVTGHLDTSNFLLLGASVLGGGIVFYLSRTGLFGGRETDRVSNTRLLTSRLFPWVLGLQALNTILQALSHPSVDWRAPVVFWTTLFVGLMLLRYWYRRRQEKSSEDVAGLFE